MERPSGAGVAWQVLRNEGAAAFRDRLLDRLAAWRRRRRYRLVATEDVAPGGAAARGSSHSVRAPVLNLLPTPPRPDLGGAQTQFLHRLDAEADERSCAVLYPESGTYRLELTAPPGRQAIRFRAPSPPRPLSLCDRDFEQVVRRAAERAGTGAVHVEQPVGLPLGSLVRLREEGLRLVLSLHDFGLFCLRPHLLEHPRLRFCHHCRDLARCGACLRCDWPVDDAFQKDRRAAAGKLLRLADAVVYPSEFLRRSYRDLMPELDPAAQRIVAPAATVRPGARRRAGRRGRIAHVAYVGGAQVHKGALLFEELVRRFPPERFPALRWSAFGGGDGCLLRRWRRLPRVHVRGYYRAGTLPELLVEHRVDVALLLSIVPESYGLTFDECLHAGVATISLDHGAVAERARSLGGATLVSPEADADDVATSLRRLLEEARRPDVSTAPAGQLAGAGSAARAIGEIYAGLGLA